MSIPCLRPNLPALNCNPLSAIEKRLNHREILTTLVLLHRSSEAGLTIWCAGVFVYSMPGGGLE